MRRDPRPRSTCRLLGAGLVRRIVRAAAPRWRRGPAAPQDRHRALAATAAPPPTGPTWSTPPAAEAAAAGEVEIVGVWSHFVYADEPGHPSIRPARSRLPRRAGRGRARLGVQPRGAAPGQLGGHADRAGSALRPRPARGGGLRAVAGAAAGRLRPGAGDDPAGAGGPGQAGRRPAPVSPTATSTPPSATPRWRWCRWATPTACPATPPTSARCRSTAPASRSAGGSAWTSSWSTSARCRWPPGMRPCCSARVTDGEPPAQDWAEATGTIHYEIVTRIGAPGAPHLPG